ncbi:sel1 repeat family protein [Pelomyxa schiedti]|nr:sel1 repeat family protein [Pelomyxa schiedti]
MQMWGVGLHEKNDVGAAQTLAMLADPAGADNAVAQYMYGVVLDAARGVERNEAEASRMFELSSEKHHATATYNLGVMLRRGRASVAKDKRRSIQLYAAAARQGVCDAQFHLGVMLVNGDAGAEDAGYPGSEGMEISLGVQLYREAAEQFLSDALQGLGFLYVVGKGVEKNVVEARRLFLLACNQPHSLAAHRLAAIHEGLLGDSHRWQDSREALRLYRYSHSLNACPVPSNTGLHRFLSTV